MFVGGFSLVFIALGASATYLGALLQEYREWISRVGGVLILALGLHLIGVFRIRAADREFRFRIANRPLGHFGTMLIGVAFGTGWTPCIGPALASILTLAAAGASLAQGIALLAAYYSAGLAIPFLFATVALDRFMARSARIKGAWLPWAERASGALILLVAILLITGSLERLAALFGAG